MLIAFILVIIPIVDQLLKKTAILYLDTKSINLIKGVLDFRLVKNKGAAFGIFGNHRVLLLIISIIALSMAIFLLFSSKEILYSAKISLSFVVGGGLGNTIDRIFRGYVIDYLDIKCINFAVFNFADICITIGGIALILKILLPRVKANLKLR